MSFAVGYLVRHLVALLEDCAGVVISTFGKVIKRGWEWLGLSPVAASYVNGLIEVFDFAACLTLNKSDFICIGSRGATYFAYRKAIQEVVSRQLAAWGDALDTDAHPRAQRFERDLARVLEDLVDEFPLLRSLVDRRPGGQKRLSMLGRGSDVGEMLLFETLVAVVEHEAIALQSIEPLSAESNGFEATSPLEKFELMEPELFVTFEAELEEPSFTATLTGGFGRCWPARYGLLVQFESRFGDSELGRLVDSTLWINDAHFAYIRASASRSVGYHLVVLVAMALAPLAVEFVVEHAFVTQFFAYWGGALASMALRKR